VRGGCGPDVVGNGVGAVGDPGDRLGQGQCGALGVVEPGRVAPGCDGEQPLVGLALLAQVAGVHVDAHTAPVDLAGPQVYQFQRPVRDAVVLGGAAERDQGLHRRGQHHDRVGHPGLGGVLVGHGRHDCLRGSVTPARRAPSLL